MATTTQQNEQLVNMGRLSRLAGKIKIWVEGETAPMQAELDEHDNLLHPIELTLHSSAGTLIEDDGSAKTTAITATAKRKGKTGDLTCTIRSISKGLQSITDTANVPLASGDNNFMVTVDVHEDSTDGDVITPKVTSEIGQLKVTLIAARRYGAAASANIDAAGMDTLTKQALATSPALAELNITEAAPFYLWLCVPASMAITKVTSSGFDVPMNAPADLNDSHGVAYKAYRSAEQVAAGSHTFKIQ